MIDASVPALDGPPDGLALKIAPMTKESLVQFLIGPAALPLAIAIAAYGLREYRGKKLFLRDGRALTKSEAPIRFWTEVLGAWGLALFLGFSGSAWLWRQYFA